MCEGDDVCWTLVSALCVRVYAAKRCHGVGYCVLYYTTEPPCSVDSHAHVLGLVVSSVSGTPPQGTGTLGRERDGVCVSVAPGGMWNRVLVACSSQAERVSNKVQFILEL
mgnify:CR=1 FL=1